MGGRYGGNIDGRASSGNKRFKLEREVLAAIGKGARRMPNRIGRGLDAMTKPGASHKHRDAVRGRDATA